MQVHATTIALQDAGLLILGPSGSGKSTLALELMATGAGLVADDRTDLRRDGDAIIASCPPALLGRIEARGIGILSAQPSGPVRLAQVIDLGAGPGDRLPQSRSYDVLGMGLPLVTGPYRPHLYAALRQLLLGGRVA
ncbi:HPr kinase/phosphorylase [Paracoccus benzoatiresistens]|uniref:HPr kinase/phosphatase C-terminal domain-containing protein n=1 Tax=Paracoccus benzoatiresistens TaxID=2997341 RepID=A0ABT4JC06_9RHOB|nr:HPr kinase/phosphatase C-terminal domain-containing protein [Paracoccus sp. EF6]MCZ0964016.1 HPr kinase/phosphatase C-terminal domain-containing protein [Paracoccus sp. EF6]